MADENGKQLPPPLYPWYQRWLLIAWDYLTWPRTARELRAAGARRTGFMAWELGPDNAVTWTGSSGQSGGDGG